LFNRSGEHRDALMARFPGLAAPGAGGDLATATIVVNATSVGMRDNSMPFDPASLPKGVALLDLVYRRGGTALVQAARARGLRAEDGREMLLEQGAQAFVQWFGYAPNKMMMRAALEDAIVQG
jgi:shikimate dehydrogenase